MQQPSSYDKLESRSAQIIMATETQTYFKINLQTLSIPAELTIKDSCSRLKTTNSVRVMTIFQNILIQEL